MRKYLLLSLVGLCLFFAGCGDTVSLFPLYSSNVLVNDDTLVGRWEDVDESGKPEKSPSLFEFTKNDDGYLLVVQDKTKDEADTIVIQLHLLRLGDKMFVDFGTPKDSDLKLKRSPYPSINVHTFGRIWIEKDSMRLELLGSDDNLKSAEVTGKVKLPYVNAESGLVITATTEQLQAFAREHADDTSLFSDETKLRRKR
ncbi:MAG: hypothetical protein WAM91_12750 [Candidatus Acidiferrales bacterium]